MITKENLGEMLLDHRDKENLTQIKISEKTGVTVQTISKVESGEVKPQTMTFRKLRKYLDTFKPVNNE